jgi:hypothetical protein
VAIGAVSPYKICGKDNIADLLTKSLERGSFMHHSKKILSGTAFDK